MALKDWRRFLTGWKKMDGSLEGIRIARTRNGYLVEKGKWSSYGTLSDSEYLKSFTNKPSATKFAKEYIRDN